jgi:hypothetical protein
MYLTGTDLKPSDFLDMDEVEREENDEALHSRVQDEEKRTTKNDSSRSKH